MNDTVQSQVEKIHASSTLAVVAVAGGGAHALTWLLAVPGASRTVLEAVAPYASHALAGFVGYTPEQAASVQTGRDMARAAHHRAQLLRTRDAPVAGIGCTAGIATDRPRKGDHRCFVSAWSQTGVASYALVLVKGLRGRADEDRVVSRLVLRALAEASGVPFDLSLELDSRERVQLEVESHGDPIARLMTGEVESVTAHRNGSLVARESVRGAVLPGSFDPLHRGHRRLAEAVAAMTGGAVTFEMSVSNVDKPDLSSSEVRRRLAQFSDYGDVVVTRAATFYQKARLLSGCSFVVGWDTAIRLVEPRYYGDDEVEMHRELDGIRRLGCRFLVAGRLDKGAFRTLADVPVPAGLEGMFEEIPESSFRCDLSSTELRLGTSQP